jgi:hypothetical protein
MVAASALDPSAGAVPGLSAAAPAWGWASDSATAWAPVTELASATELAWATGLASDSATAWASVTGLVSASVPVKATEWARAQRAA